MASVVDSRTVVAGHGVTYTWRIALSYASLVLILFCIMGVPVATVRLARQAGKHNGRIGIQFGGTFSDSTPKRRECSS